MNYLVTGCSRGVGLKICEVLIREGHTVYAVARSYTEEFKALEAASDGRLFFKSVDLSIPFDIRQTFFKEYLTSDIRLDGFVNNAAVAYDDIVTNLNADRLQAMYAVNVFTPMMITKYAIRHMLLHKNKGSIVHISSISAHTGYKGLAMYASTKGAIEAFSKNTAREWGIRKIRSNCVVAGFMETDMSASLPEEQKEKIFNRTSLKIPADTASVAKTVVFLLGDSSKSITGQNIFVDSGTL